MIFRAPPKKSFTFLAVYTPYIPSFGGYIIPTTPYNNQKNPLKKKTFALSLWDSSAERHSCSNSTAVSPGNRLKAVLPQVQKA